MLCMHRVRREHPQAFRLIALIAIAAAICGALFLLVPRDAAAQAGPRSATMLILKDQDTLVVERVQRSDRNITAVIGAPGQPRVSMLYTLGADHLIPTSAFSLQAPGAPDDAAPVQSGTVTITADSAFMSITAGGQTREFRVKVPAGTLPVVNNDFVTAEQAVRIARAGGVTSLRVPLFAMSAAQVVQGTLELVGTDSARFTVMGNVTMISVDRAGNVTGGVIPSQGLRIVVLQGAAAARVGFGKPNYSAPAGAPYTAEDVTVRTPAGHVLVGTLTLPHGANASAKVPAVVTITGSGHQDRDEFIPVAGGFRLFRQVADTLSRRGIAVLRLDDRGIGGSGGDARGTSADFADDIRAGVAFLRERPEVDAARIGLVGHSEGGMIAPMIGASDPRIAAIALLAGTAYTGRQIIDYQMENGARADTTLNATQRDSLVRAMRAAFDTTSAREGWMKYFLTHDPVPTIRRVKQPVLILQGATDQQVRPEEAEMLDRALRESGNPRVTLRILPERNHLFLRDADGHPSRYGRLTNPKVDGEVLGVLADWLAATLRATP